MKKKFAPIIIRTSKKGVIFFKEGRIGLFTMEQPLELNFRRKNIKKLREDFVRRASGLYIREAKFYFIEVKIGGMLATSRLSKEALIRNKRVIKRTIG